MVAFTPTANATKFYQIGGADMVEQTDSPLVLALVILLALIAFGLAGSEDYWDRTAGIGASMEVTHEAH